MLFHVLSSSVLFTGLTENLNNDRMGYNYKKQNESYINKLLSKNSLNIHKPEFMEWESAFTLVSKYLEDIKKDSDREHPMINTKKRSLWYNVNFDLKKKNKVHVWLREGDRAVAIYIELRK